MPGGTRRGTGAGGPSRVGTVVRPAWPAGEERAKGVEAARTGATGPRLGPADGGRSARGRRSKGVRACLCAGTEGSGVVRVDVCEPLRARRA